MLLINRRNQTSRNCSLLCWRAIVACCTPAMTNRITTAKIMAPPPTHNGIHTIGSAETIDGISVAGIGR